MRLPLIGPVVVATALTLGANAFAASTNDWLGYNGSYAGDRYSTLKQIDRTNAAHLHAVCAFQFGELGPAQTAPVVAGGVMYVTGEETTYALDAKTCRVRWKSTYVSTGPKAALANRGVALLDGKVFRGTPDSHLIAIDAATGQTLWNVPVSDSSDGSNTAAAPLAWQGKVYIGIAGSEDGVKGKVMAFSAADGTQLWTFSTIASGDDPGAADVGQCGRNGDRRRRHLDVVRARPGERDAVRSGRESRTGLLGRLSPRREPLHEFDRGARREYGEAALVLSARSARLPRLGRGGAAGRSFAGPTASR